MYCLKKEFKEFTSSLKPSVKFNYIIAYPEDYSENESLPMVVFLHGAGERGVNVEALLNTGVTKYLNAFPARAIVLAPQITVPDHVWNNYADEAFELIEKIALDYNADEDRISLTGLSMGGYGTWEIATLHYDFFSAIAPICGGGMPWRSEVLKNLPIRTFHGDIDPVVPISASFEMVNAINANGGNVQFSIFHNVMHDSWTPAYETTDVISWLIAQNKADRK